MPHRSTNNYIILTYINHPKNTCLGIQLSSTCTICPSHSNHLLLIIWSISFCFSHLLLTAADVINTLNPLINTHTQTHTQTYTHTHTDIHVHTQTQTHTHAHTHTHICTDIHTHTHTHTHTCTHTHAIQLNLKLTTHVCNHHMTWHISVNTCNIGCMCTKDQWCEHAHQVQIEVRKWNRTWSLLGRACASHTLMWKTTLWPICKKQNCNTLS